MAVEGEAKLVTHPSIAMRQLIKIELDNDGIDTLPNAIIEFD